MTTVRGKIISVTTRTPGSVVVSTTNTNTVLLATGADFDEDGGLVAHNGDVLTYTSLEQNPDTGQWVMSFGSPVSVEEDDEVHVYPLGQVKVAKVYQYDNSDAVDAVVPFGWMDKIDDGIRDEEDQEECLIGTNSDDDEDDERWEVVALDGEMPQIDARYIDDETVGIDISPPTDPPASSPSVGVTPTHTSFIVVTGDIEQSTVLDYYVNGVLHPDFTETRKTAVQIDTLPTGNAFEMGADYTFHVEASNVIGSAPPGPTVAAQLLPPSEQITPEMVLGLLNVAIVNAGVVNVGDITIDADNGINIPQGNSTTRSTHFPANGTMSKFGGDAEVDGLNILGKMRIQGQTNELAVGASLEAKAGMSAPKMPPSVELFAPTVDSHAGFAGKGLAYHAARNCWYMAESVGTAVISTLSSDFSFGFDNFDLKTAGGRPEITSGLGGIAMDGNRAFVLCQTNTAIPGTYSPRWFIYQFEWLYWLPGEGSTWQFINRTLYEPNTSLGGHSTYYPCIATDGDKIYVAQAAKLGRVWITRWDISGDNLINQATTACNEESGGIGWNLSRHIHGFEVSPADVGSSRYWITSEGSNKVFCVQGFFERETSNDWTTVSSAIRGLAWRASDGRFISKHEDRATAYSKIKTSPTISAVNTLRIEDATPPDYAAAETSASPAESKTVTKRRWVRLSSGLSIPPGANSVSFYINNQRVATPAVGVEFVELDQIPTGGGSPPGTTAGFPSGTSSHHSDLSLADIDGPIWHLEGDGVARIGPWKSDANGEATGHPYKSGQVNTGAFSGTNVTNSIPVVFDEPFPPGTTVDVVVSPRGLTNSYSAGCGAVSITRFGFTITAGRTSGTGAFDVTWIAIPRLAS